MEVKENIPVVDNKKTDFFQEKIVLTPKSKTSNSTTLWIERMPIENFVPGEKVFVAGGSHQGIVINKQEMKDTKSTCSPHISLEFRVYLINNQTGNQTQETRTLNFWYRQESENEVEQATVAQEFFASLVHPKEFPRDYVGFIKKIMKLLQQEFLEIERIELVLSQIEQENIFQRPPSPDDFNLEKVRELTEEHLIHVVESSYPNPLTVEDLSRKYKWSNEDLLEILHKLKIKGLVKEVEHGGYTRVTQGDMEVKIVNQMPKFVRAKQPTLAIITAQFTEKLAVDAMIENKETFVRYTTIGLDNESMRPRFGESNVYTLGNIGNCRVVCTKLPSVGHTREAMTAAGNTTTRLLGTFQNVDHVILVGTGGGVPHFTDYSKHVRLGDVVISHANSLKSESVYYSCEGATEISPKVFSFHFKEYTPKNNVLQSIAAQMATNPTNGSIEFVWKCLDEGLALLGKDSEHDFKRPPSDTDKIYMAVGERDLIEVKHPLPQDRDEKRTEGRPRLHLGLIGAGRDIARSDLYRQKFSQAHQILAFVSEFDPVIESIIGNCRESFIFIRGISDYKDGGRRTEWQPYAALVAAAVTKAVTIALDSVNSRN